MVKAYICIPEWVKWVPKAIVFFAHDGVVIYKAVEVKGNNSAHPTDLLRLYELCPLNF